jgi:alpha-1,3-glucan synthase
MFLWSAPIPKLAILGLIFTFFIIVWGVMLWILAYFSKTHTWLLPVFAVGLGAPRWCQVSSAEKELWLRFSSCLRCYGGRLHWLCTYPGRAKQDHIWGHRFGFGLEYLMLSKVSG